MVGIRLWTSLCHATWFAVVSLFVGIPRLATAQRAPTPQQISNFRADIIATFANNVGGPGTSGGGPPLLRTLVRLAFHDCASAKCDGCIDTADTLNNPGLGAMQTAIQPLCTKYSLNTADCWAAAASIALEQTSYNGPDLARIPLFFGRADAATCTGFTQANPEATFPAAAAGLGPGLAYFSETFNLTGRETVALLGVHSLGVASPKGSGFDGAWTIAPNTMDNTFYSDMLKGQLGWGVQQLPGPARLYQWTSATGQQLMLNSDMCLLLDIFNETSGGTGPQLGFSPGGIQAGASAKPVCTYDTCTESPTAGIVREFAVNNTLFMEEFVAVWIKMVTKGYDVCDLTVLPSEGQRPDYEELYGIDVLTQDCAAAAQGPTGFEYSGPVTSGVLGGPATPSGGPTAAAAGPAGGAVAPGEMQSPAGESTAGLGLGSDSETHEGALTPLEAGEAADAVEGGVSGCRRLGVGGIWAMLGVAVVALCVCRG